MALTKPSPSEVILALRPLLENTLHSPANEKTPKHLNRPDDLVAYMNDLGERISWVPCPRCGREWNVLTPGGDCIGCVDEDVESDSRQRELGVYLRKTIGKFGVETYRFDNFKRLADNEQAYRSCEHFDWRRDNLFLWGPCGTGKTHLAGAVLKRAAAQNLFVKWLNPIWIGRIMRAKWAQDEQAAIDLWSAQQVLIIDDLGVGRDLDVTLRSIYEICEKRKASKMNGLLITSNESLQDLADKFRDDRIVSRIAGLCKIVKIDGPDSRLVMGDPSA